MTFSTILTSNLCSKNVTYVSPPMVFKRAKTTEHPGAPQGDFAPRTRQGPQGGSLKPTSHALRSLLFVGSKILPLPLYLELLATPLVTSGYDKK